MLRRRTYGFPCRVDHSHHTRSLSLHGSHMSPMIGESLSVIIQGENSQAILLMSNHRQ